MVWEENPDKGWYKQVAAPANMLDWREQVPAFDGLAAYESGRTYLNFNERRTSASSFFGEATLARLTAIRDAVDPDRVLLANHQIG